MKTAVTATDAAPPPDAEISASPRTIAEFFVKESTPIDAMCRICHECPEAKVIILTTYPGDAQVQRAIQAALLATC